MPPSFLQNEAAAALFKFLYIKPHRRRLRRYGDPMGIPAVPPPTPSFVVRLRGMPDFWWPGSLRAAAERRRRPSFKTCSPQKSHSPSFLRVLLVLFPLSIFFLSSSPFPFQFLFRRSLRRRRCPTRYMLHCMRRLWSTKPTDERRAAEEEDDESRSLARVRKRE